MKSLQALYSQVGIQLNAKYYVPYLDKEEMEVINQAVKQKKSLRYQFNLLRLLALKIITELKRSVLFHGEQRWTIAFANTEAALLTGQQDPRELCQALHGADDLIEAAWVTRAVRRDILVAVQERSVLSESQDRQYEAIRQAYLAHNETLTELDEQVYQLKNKFFQNPGRHSAAPLWKMVRRDFPSALLNYRTGVYKLQLSDQNIMQLIQAEGNVREVYQDLTARLMKKPTIETIAEEIKSAKVFLTDKATTIIDNAGQLRQAILQETQQAIEHRSQVKLAHAEKVECLLMALAKIVQLLQSYISRSKNHTVIVGDDDRSQSDASGAGGFSHDSPVDHFTTKITDAGYSPAKFCAIHHLQLECFFLIKPTGTPTTGTAIKYRLAIGYRADDHAVIWFE